MTLYKPDLANNIDDDIVGIAGALTELDGSEMEFDYNANGYFVKFGNGLLVCFHKLQLTYNITTHLRTTWTYPHAFHAAPEALSVTPSDTSTSFTPAKTEISYIGGDVEGTTTTSILIAMYRGFGLTNFQAGDTCYVRVIAVGRWK